MDKMKKCPICNSEAVINIIDIKEDSDDNILILQPCCSNCSTRLRRKYFLSLKYNNNESANSIFNLIIKDWNERMKN